MDILWQAVCGDLPGGEFLTGYLPYSPQQPRVPRIAERETRVVVPRKDNEPHPIDVYVGGRMRLRRIQLGLSQGALASKIGVSFQAVQKYESGDIRISASRLYDVSQVLEVSPAFFFEGYPDGMVAKNLAEDVAPGDETFDRREIMSLIRGYYGIRDPHLQADILRLISKLGNRASEPTA
jgi:transcriptional regulator with XRE-family HTH domain